MKKSKFKHVTRAMMLIGIFSLVTLVSCTEKEPEVDAPVASFQFALSDINYLEVSFTNFSQNATSYNWNFGDGETSTEMSPVHVFALAGTYTVVLTASNEENTTATFSQTIDINDPNSELTLLAGETSKTWKLFREGSSMGVGPDGENPRLWWALENTGGRPCVYYHEFTFNKDGSFVFDDKGSFWGEGAIFGTTALNETCFDAIASNMVNSDGADVSAWLSGTHAFTYDPAVGQITLNGMGAWMGLPQLGTNAESIVPEATRTFSASIEEMTGYDLLTISYAYAELYWDFTYVSYSDPSLEPDVVTVEPPYGEDLTDFAPESFFNTFASIDATDVQYLIPTESSIIVNVGVDDPADPTAAKVGEYIRGTELYADFKFQMDFDIQFDDYTSFSIDVYVPSTNTYETGGLTKNIQIWIADASQTQEFWSSWVQYDVNPDDIIEDQWITYTFDLETPSAGTGTPKTRTDLDLVGLVIGGSGHAIDGTFYVRNFTFN